MGETKISPCLLEEMKEYFTTGPLVSLWFNFEHARFDILVSGDDSKTKGMELFEHCDSLAQTCEALVSQQ